jgi:hypothetical protein
MRKQIENSPVAFEALEPGEPLERGGVVPADQNGIYLFGGIEIVDTPANLADFGRYLVATFGHNPPPMVDPQVLLVGRVSDGYKAYGPFSAADDLVDGEAHDRIRFIEEEGSQDYAVLPVLPLTELATLHGNDPLPPLKLGQPGTAVVAADVEIPGVGTIRAGHDYIVWTRHGDGPGQGSAFALVGREMVEAADRLDDGTPDWANAGLVDVVTADEGFFHPAYALLRFMANDWHGKSTWAKDDHDVLTDALRGSRVESWTYDVGQECYRMSEGADDEFIIRTPAEARAYAAALRAVR